MTDLPSEQDKYKTEFKDDHDAASVSLAGYVPNSPEEKKLLRKLDLRIGKLEVFRNCCK